MNDFISLLIVDDHEIVRQGVKAFLELHDDIRVVGQADNGSMAIAQAASTLPDVVLLDLIMPGDINGVKATREIKKVSPHTQIIILTSYHDDEHIFPAIRAGALSYILKNITPEDLVHAVRKASLSEPVINTLVANQLLQEFNQPKKHTDFDGTSQLSNREMEVLSLLAEGLPNSELSAHLNISVKTVKTHISNILSKLHLRDRTQAAVYAWKNGVKNTSQKEV